MRLRLLLVGKKRIGLLLLLLILLAWNLLVSWLELLLFAVVRGQLVLLRMRLMMRVMLILLLLLDFNRRRRRRWIHHHSAAGQLVLVSHWWLLLVLMLLLLRVVWRHAAPLLDQLLSGRQRIRRRRRGLANWCRRIRWRNLVLLLGRVSVVMMIGREAISGLILPLGPLRLRLLLLPRVLLLLELAQLHVLLLVVILVVV